MNLSDALDEMVQTRESHGPRCSVAILLDSLSDGDARKLSMLIDEPLPSGKWVPCTKIAVVLRDQGVDFVGAHAVQRHRRRKRRIGDCCQCPT